MKEKDLYGLKSVSRFQRLRITNSSSTFCVFNLFFWRSSLVLPFFHCFSRSILTLFWLSLFLVILACPLAFEFLGLFYLLTFSQVFHFCFIEIFTYPQCRVWSYSGFSWKKNYSGLKWTTRDIFISECERNNKDGLSSFQVQEVKINKIWPHLVWWFDLCKEMHFMSLWTMSPLHTIMHTFKTHGSRVMVWGWRFIFYSCTLV